MDTQEILSKVIEEIKPKDDLWPEIEDFLKILHDILNQKDIKAEIVVGGSIAKDTHLKNDHDCDMFAKFDMKYKDEDISEMMHKAVKELDKKAYEVERLHGSRDYFQIQSSIAHKIKYEIVPVLAIDKPEDALNVTDVSPFHVLWAKKSDLQDDIRLAKAFCKAGNVYGAESYIGGFSGHVLDIMTIHYGGFLKLLEASKEWNKGYVIDPENMGDAKLLNPSKLGYIIVFDPVQPDRNAAAALSEEKVEIFKKLAKRFLTKSDIEAFHKKPFSMDKIIEKNPDTDIIFLKIKTPEGKTDVIGAKVVKVMEYIAKQSKLYGFDLHKRVWDWNKDDKAILGFIYDKEPLPEIRTRMGPPLKRESDVIKFKSKHKEVFEEDERVYAKDKVEFRHAKDFIQHLIDSVYIKEKLDKIKILE